MIAQLLVATLLVLGTVTIHGVGLLYLARMLSEER